MISVNMHQAKSELSRLVDAIERGTQDRIVIARNGRPAAMLVAITDAVQGRRIGVAKGKFVMPESIDIHNDEIAALFNGEPS